MSRRIYFNAWGRGAQKLEMPAYAMFDPRGYDGESGCVAAAIARKNGLVVVTLRHDGQACERGSVVADHYQTTLGRPCRGGGHTPVAELWFSVPLAAREDQ